MGQDTQWLLLKKEIPPKKICIQASRECTPTDIPRDPIPEAWANALGENPLFAPFGFVTEHLLPAQHSKDP